VVLHSFLVAFGVVVVLVHVLWIGVIAISGRLVCYVVLWECVG